MTTNIVTHAHPDHFHIENFMLLRAFTGGLDIPNLRLYGPRDVTSALEKAMPDLSTLRMDIRPVSAFQTWMHAGYTFNTYRAVGIYEAIFYCVDDGQHSFLCATDTSRFPEETWEVLAGKPSAAGLMPST